MTPSQQIRMLEPRDVPACMGIAALSWDRLIGGMAQADLNESFGTSPWRPVFYVAEVDGRVVGFAAYGCSWLGYCIYSITWVNVHPDFQRRGIGRALISRCLDDLKPIARVVILITENAAPLYQQFGFKPLAQYASESNGGAETLMALEFREAARSASGGVDLKKCVTCNVMRGVEKLTDDDCRHPDCPHKAAPAPAETAPPHSWSYINTLIGWTCRHCGIADRGPHHSLPISGCSRPSPVSTPPDAAQGKPPCPDRWHKDFPYTSLRCPTCNPPPPPDRTVAESIDAFNNRTTTGESGLRECPFCKGTRTEIVFLANTSGAGRMVRCHDCLAEGPPKPEKAEAIAAWNTRSTPRAMEGDAAVIEMVTRRLRRIAAGQVSDIVVLKQWCVDAADLFTRLHSTATQADGGKR